MTTWECDFCGATGTKNRMESIMFVAAGAERATHFDTCEGCGQRFNAAMRREAEAIKRETAGSHLTARDSQP